MDCDTVPLLADIKLSIIVKDPGKGIIADCLSIQACPRIGVPNTTGIIMKPHLNSNLVLLLILPLLGG